MRWRFGSPGLLVRVATALAVVALVPLALVSWQLVSLNREAMTDQVLRSHVIAARSSAERVESWLAARSTLGATLAIRPELVGGDRIAAHRLLEESLSAWADLGVLAVALVDDQGREAVRAQLAFALARAAAEATHDLPFEAGARGVRASQRLVVAVDVPASYGGVRLTLDGAGLGALLPPPFAESWARRHSRATDWLDRIERRVDTWRVVYSLADHYVVEMVRGNA